MSALKDLATALRLLERSKKLDGKVPDGEDIRNYLSKKDRMDCERMMNRYGCGVLPPLPPPTAFAEWREQQKTGACRASVAAGEQMQGDVPSQDAGDPCPCPAPGGGGFHDHAASSGDSGH